MDKIYINGLLDLGFNCMPINEDKTPKVGWKNWQTDKIKSLSDFKFDSEYYALICGYNDVECIDVDLKVLPSKKEREHFWNNLLSFIDDNIEDYKEKLVIKKTRSSGYHIIYRALNIEGNLKLAKVKDHQEAIIETRGVGGYICMYDEIYNLNYNDIKLIENEEREIIINICRTLNEDAELTPEITVSKKVEKHYNENTLTPWEDYNNRNSILDVVGDEFSVVKDTPTKTIIRRHGATSPHSGYIYKDSGCMYLFSSGTQYEAQRLISPFVAYAIKKHLGDMSNAASHLYSIGYGGRKKPRYTKPTPISKKIIEQYDFPVDIFPEEIQFYITECSRTLQNSVDYMGCSLLWVGSLIVGNSLRVEIKKGWQEISTIWMSVVGEAGIGKSPSIDSIVKPLQEINGQERKRYYHEKKLYDEYMQLNKKEKEQVSEVLEPKKTHFILDDVTIEALINLHSQNLNGVGVLKDELAGWFKDMNKYKDGSDKEQWLSSWSGKGISVDRITRQSDYLAKPVIPVLGGIQPGILTGFFTEENKDNGFIDRMLFTFPDMVVNKYIDDEIDAEILKYYEDWVLNMWQEMRKIVSYSEIGEIEPKIANFSNDAKKEWVRIFNEITILQNSDETNEFYKSMLAKQKSYICRFALIINTLNADWIGDGLLVISKESILKAEKLYKYFTSMYQKMVSTNMDNANNRNVIRSTKGDIYAKIEAIYNSNKDFNKSQVAKELNISRQLIYKYIKEIKNEN